MPGKKTRASLTDVAKEAGTYRDRASAALKDSPDLPEEFKQKVREAAKKVGYVDPTPNQHYNSKLDQDKADRIFDGIVKNESLSKIANETGLSEHTAFKYIRGVKVPSDYPETEEGWRQDVTGFLEVAIWKGTKRLAESSMLYIDDRSLPIAVGVLTDKLATIKGQPTSIHLAMNASVSHRDLMADLKNRSAETNVTPVNDEQIPDDV